MKNKIIFTFLIASALVTGLVEAKSVPKQNRGESRIRQVIYDPNQVVEVGTSFGYATTVEFGNEIIKTAVSGDTIGWQIVPQGNRLFIKPAEQAQKGLNGTNITVITDKRNYYLHTYIGNRTDPVFVVRFNYDIPPPPQSTAPIQADGKPYKNYNYKIAGSNSIGVKKVWDDGEMTYIEFDPKKPMPAIFGVNADGFEELVNTRKEGKYMVVEKISMLLSLKIGDQVKCIRNFSYSIGGN
jgi:type IV secretion system protein VirB9